jgi:hypothetical protein
MILYDYRYRVSYFPWLCEAFDPFVNYGNPGFSILDINTLISIGNKLIIRIPFK